ncbi:MAG: DnaJ domain-containing protein [Deltaproteobacteria bacterium]|nr:DnaJ domain-containing protein [Deltaproteobacteria bacterium]
MATDFYSVLGVGKNAEAAEIKKAYRKLASSLHPDKHPGDKSAETRFKRVNQAYQVLSDPKKKALYDEFGEQGLAEGFNADRARAYQSWSKMGAGRGGVGGPGSVFEVEDLFGRASGGGLGDMLGDLFGRVRGGGGARQQPQTRGQDIQSELTIDFVSAVNGNTVALQIDGSSEPVQVRIPPGANEGSRLRIKGQGGASPFGGARGDLLLTIHVTPHPSFRMEGDDLHLNLPITVGEAYRGAKVKVPTPRGEVSLKVPAGAQSGQMVRLRGKGVSKAGRAAGDLYVHFQIRIPTVDAPEVRAAIDQLEEHADASLRDDLHF